MQDFVILIDERSSPFSHFMGLIDGFFEHIGGISTSRSRPYYGAMKVHDAMRAK